MPTEVYENSIVLTHWGRIELDHVSNTAFKWDDYNQVTAFAVSVLEKKGGRQGVGKRSGELQPRCAHTGAYWATHGGRSLTMCPTPPLSGMTIIR